MYTLQTAISIVHAYAKDCQTSGFPISRAFICHFDFKVGGTYGIEILLVSTQFGNDIFENLKLLKSLNEKYSMVEILPYSESTFSHNDAFIDGVLKWGLESKVC
ncbi:MAG: hypothetical protein ABL895_07885 [Cyclobacteriaceae bacterium]